MIKSSTYIGLAALVLVIGLILQLLLSGLMLFGLNLIEGISLEYTWTNFLGMVVVLFVLEAVSHHPELNLDE